MIDICCVGHITADKVVTPKLVRYMPGGTAYYFSCAVASLDINYLLVTSIAPAEMQYADKLHDLGIKVQIHPSAHTVHFENIYGNNPDERTQNVLEKADAFTIDQLQQTDAKIYHLGPLLADDISADVVKMLAAKGLVSLDVQGYLREVVNKKVYATYWHNKKDILQYVHTLKADEAELRALTDCDSVHMGVRMLADMGVKEIVITNGSKGSLIFNDNIFYNIPSYHPINIVDATGCGDTYMAGYLYQRVKGNSVQKAGEFGAAMATLKMESSGPFIGTEDDVMQLLTANGL